MRGGLFGRSTGGDVLTGLLPAVQRERSERRQPFRQDGEGLAAGMTDPAPDPEALVLVIVRWPQSPSVAGDGVVVAQRAQPRQQLKRNHPGSRLSCGSGSAIKRITAGVKARR
jgi:hypothetical protein